MRYLFVLLTILVVAVVQAEPQSPMWRVHRPTYNKGAEVLVTAVDGSPASPPIQRIVAKPGDRIRIDSSGVYVNDVLVAGISPSLLASLGVWNRQTIPADHYFVVGELKVNDSASRAGAILPVKRIVGLSQR